MANQDVTRIASNIGALNSLWALQTVNNKLGVAQTRLSTGKRINSAADDPAGLTIATKLNARSQGLTVALSNIGDAKNLLAVAEAGVGRITDILVQMKSKASQAASDTMGAAERDAIKAQLDAYVEQIDDIVAQTSWNGNKLIDGSYLTTALSFQTGADAADVTNVNGLSNLSATSGSRNLALATKAAADGVTASDTAAITAAAATGTVDADADVIGTGAYTVRVTVGTTTTTTPDTIELLDSAGNALKIGTTGTTSMSADLSAGAAVDFGNGIVATFAAVTEDIAAADGLELNFVAEGTYNVLAGGATGDTLVDATDYRTLMTTLEGKLDSVNAIMAKIGAFTGRLEFKEATGFRSPGQR